MQKTLWVFLTALTLGLGVASCKKDNPATPPLGNNPHPLTNTYYFRAKIDTTWTYIATDEKIEDTLGTSTRGIVFQAYDPTRATLVFIDSAYPRPQDTTIQSWVGQYFSFYNYADTARPLMIKFQYQDSLGRRYSTEYTDNRASSFTIDSVIADGNSALLSDTAGVPYKLFKIKGSISCNLARFQDSSSVIHTYQGLYSVRVMEGRRQ